MLKNKRSQQQPPNSLKIGAFVLICLALGGCNPGYILRAAYEQSKILLKREPISEILQDSETPLTEKEKLQLVLEAREFAKEIGLNPGDSYTLYSKLDRDELAWVLLGAKPDSFSLHTWWFPIVGDVPYKGFFDKESAKKAEKILKAKGFETWLRSTDAISTLGWFNDPVLSTFLRHNKERIANTVIHESVHATVWIKGQVDFNESFANFVGVQGASDFFEQRLLKCEPTDTFCIAKRAHMAALGYLQRRTELYFSDVMNALYSELDKLYRSELSKEKKLIHRKVVFDKHMAPLRKRYPKMKAFKTINNAEIMQLKLYITQLRDFQKLFALHNGQWDKFMAEIKGFNQKLEEDESLKPFELLTTAIEKREQR